MLCPEAQPLLETYLHGELDAGRMRAVQLHLAGCNGCRKELKRLRLGADVVVPFHLAAVAHGELASEEQETVEAHLAWCDPCREEAGRIRAAANELLKNLCQYQLTPLFRTQVMREWKPHRMGRRVRHNLRGLADTIARAEGGNTFSYERLVDRFKDYAYVAAFLRVGDFFWATEIAREIFVQGLPVFADMLTQADFLAWLAGRTAEIAERGDWLSAGEAVGKRAVGLSGFEASRKLRRHRLILELHTRMDEKLRVPLLLHYVQRLRYAQIESLLELSRTEVMAVLRDATAAGMEALEADLVAHPRPVSEMGWARMAAEPAAG
jgi:anti-sigma factor RsiW